MRPACRLPSGVAATCEGALERPGRLFSAAPLWSRLFLAWMEALTELPRETYLPDAVACECMAAGYDLVDGLYDYAPETLADALPGDVAAGISLLLLAQETLASLDLPAARCLRASAALARAGRRALAGQTQDYALRQAPPAGQDVLLAVLRRRSGTLAAAPCQCAALLAGAHWPIVALASRLGQALGCAGQLEDDLADRQEDTCLGRQTIPLLLAHLSPGATELVETTSWVLIRRYQREAMAALERLPLPPARKEAI